jgi:hypothetical protein
VSEWPDAARQGFDIKVRISCRAFRATGIIAYREAGARLENAQAPHQCPRTTKLYDRTGDQIALDEVERVAG